MADMTTSLPPRRADSAPSSARGALNDSDVVLEFSGRFRFGIDQWAYVPFTVPPEVARIVVTTGHQALSVLGVARNVLDLGIFGPEGYDVGNAAGFRGWSGGARSGYALSAGSATPGYLPGPLTPGTWTLAFGPVVLNPLGMDWWARVVLEFGRPEAEPPPRPRFAAGTSRRRGAAWYRGDLHTHTVHSDGHYQPHELSAVADDAGLDFVVSTEHNTNSANLSRAGFPRGGPEIVPGEEVTTRHGHWLAVGLPPDCWVDWRYAPRDGVFTRFAAQVRVQGGLVVAAHPAVPLPGAAWEFGYGDVDAIEVWNGLWNLDDELALRIWHRLLVRGRRITAVGGSDSHGAHQRVGRPQTVVFAENLTTADLIAGLRNGHCYLTETDSVTIRFTAAAGDATVVGPGGTLTVGPETAVKVMAEVRGAPNAVIDLITARGRVARAPVGESGTAIVRWTTLGADARFARLEVRRRQRQRRESMVALSNPIWISEAR
ncbi:CehA/McbA family metallohydrolase [Mycolicibacterium iranicum]|nr:CehA/McbA family metallohydrolase [Mycolicibacterium iranicum]